MLKLTFFSRYTCECGKFHENFSAVNQHVRKCGFDQQRMKENLANNVKSELLEPEIKLEIKDDEEIKLEIKQEEDENQLKIDENQLKINENQLKIKEEPEDDYEKTERIDASDPNASIVLNHSAICDEQSLIKKK